MGMRHVACQCRRMGLPAAMQVACSQQTKIVRIPTEPPHAGLKWCCYIYVSCFPCWSTTILQQQVSREILGHNLIGQIPSVPESNNPYDTRYDPHLVFLHQLEVYSTLDSSKLMCGSSEVLMMNVDRSFLKLDHPAHL